MDTYKFSSILEGLFNIKKEDSLRILSLNPASSCQKGNEGYVLAILVTRNAEKTGETPAEKSAETAVEKHPSGKTPAGIIIP